MNLNFSTLIACAMLASSTAVAGVVGPNTNSNNDVKPEVDSQNYQLRCYQYGKLIFAENGWSGINVTSENALMAFNNVENGRDRLYLLDLENATCLYRSPK